MSSAVHDAAGDDQLTVTAMCSQYTAVGDFGAQRLSEVTAQHSTVVSITVCAYKYNYHHHQQPLRSSSPSQDCMITRPQWQVLASNTTIKRLDLKQNGITDTGASALMEALKASEVQPSALGRQCVGEPCIPPRTVSAGIRVGPDGSDGSTWAWHA